MVCYTYTVKFYSALKKNVTMTFSGEWMEPKTLMLCEISQTQEDKYYMLSP